MLQEWKSYTGVTICLFFEGGAIYNTRLLVSLLKGNGNQFWDWLLPELFKSKITKFGFDAPCNCQIGPSKWQLQNISKTDEFNIYAGQTSIGKKTQKPPWDCFKLYNIANLSGEEKEKDRVAELGQD